MKRCTCMVENSAKIGGQDSACPVCFLFATSVPVFRAVLHSDRFQGYLNATYKVVIVKALLSNSSHYHHEYTFHLPRLLLSVAMPRHMAAVTSPSTKDIWRERNLYSRKCNFCSYVAQISYVGFVTCLQHTFSCRSQQFIHRIHF